MKYKNEFLIKLREALTAELPSKQVEEHIAFYDQYIYDEITKGRTEEEVLSELGDPWIIARNILSMSDVTEQNEYVYGESDRGYEQSDSMNDGIRMFRRDNWWKKLLILAVVLAVLSVIFSVITGILRLVAPIAIPVIAVMLILKIWKK